MITCIWTENSDGVWETECKSAFELTTGTPDENEMHFCCYCGKPLKQVKYVEPIEDEE